MKQCCCGQSARIRPIKDHFMAPSRVLYMRPAEKTKGDKCGVNPIGANDDRRLNGAQVARRRRLGQIFRTKEPRVVVAAACTNIRNHSHGPWSWRRKHALRSRCHDNDRPYRAACPRFVFQISGADARKSSVFARQHSCRLPRAQQELASYQANRRALGCIGVTATTHRAFRTSRKFDANPNPWTAEHAHKRNPIETNSPLTFGRD
jgi:hypothetical protein